MAQANAETIISRRGLLRSAGASALVAAALPVPSAASSADPIYAAIEAHRAAVKTFLDAVDAECWMEKEIPRSKRRSRFYVGQEEIVPGDDPRWIEVARHGQAASQAETDAACVLADVEPTTLAGAVAVLNYAVEHCRGRYDEWPSGLVDSNDTSERPIERDWSYYFHRTLASALAKIVAGAA